MKPFALTGAAPPTATRSATRSPSFADVSGLLEPALERAMGRAAGPGCPPALSRALRHAVFPRGARLRPSLCILTAVSCGARELVTAATAGVAIELLHSASLVHDDLPCFDDAEVRRGRASVHHAFGEAIAVLTGDALIVAAFEEVAIHVEPRMAARMILVLARAAGSAGGIVAGQAWESEPSVRLERYHRAKTAALFEAATALGALAVGVDPAPWRPLGDALGCAYQALDDLQDAVADPAEAGKPTGRDEALDRPSLVRARGVDGARAVAAEMFERARDAVPAGASDGGKAVCRWIEELAGRTLHAPQRGASGASALRAGR